MRRTLSLLLGASLLWVATSARASDVNNQKEADQRFKEGLRLLNAGDFEHARLAFAQANALVRSTNALWNEIMSEFYSGHYVDCLNHARTFVRDPKAPAANTDEANAKIIPQASQKVGQVQIDAPAGTLLEIDSKDKVGQAPLLDPVAVTPGKHTVVGHLGSEVLTSPFEIGAGQTIHVKLTSATQEPSAAAEVDESMLERSGAHPAAGNAGATTADAGVPRQRTATQKWITLGLGLGAVGLGIASAVMFAQAGSASDDVDRLRASTGPQGSCPSAPGCADLLDRLRAHNHDLTAGYVLGGGALVVAGAAAFVWFEPFGKKNSQAFIPVAGPGFAGLSLRRSF